MDTLPDEIKIRILNQLDTKELGRVGNVNRELSNLSSDQSIWKDKVKTRFGDIPQICDSWKLTYRDYPNVRARRVKVVTHADYNEVDGLTSNVIGLYDFDEDIHTIVEDIFDTLIDFYGDVPIVDDFTTHYRYTVYPHILNNYVDEININKYQLALKDYILSRTEKDLDLRGNGWEIKIKTRPINYTR